VVSNPLLNSEISPIANKLYTLLEQLDANFVQWLAWVTYPKMGVAELEPPNLVERYASWDFSNIEIELRRVMDITFAKGKTVIVNYCAQPTWMYNTPVWDYPDNVNAVSWDYSRGNVLPNTTELLVGYYTRLLSWMMLGSFVDEFGITHYNTGDTYQLTHWAVFNEPENCHGQTPEIYTQQYDQIVAAIRKNLDPQMKMQFVGLVLAYATDESWITYFLDPDNHIFEALPIEWIDFHHYASCSDRVNPNAYEEFFPQAEDLILQAQRVMNIKNTLSPFTKIYIGELGIILPDENDPNAAQFPLIYWNAAAAFYAYVFGNLAPMGYDAIGMSQFAGSPAIPEWGIPDAQYPSVSMTNWTTGEGTARYWTLKLLIDNFQPGDIFVAQQSNIPQQVFCADLNTFSEETLSLTCTDPNTYINAIQFAAYGLPTGSCGNYSINAKCNATNVLPMVENSCIGRRSCDVSTQSFTAPCAGVLRFVIQATFWNCRRYWSSFIFYRLSCICLEF